MQVTVNEVLEQLQHDYPDQVETCTLRVLAAKQQERIAQLELELEGVRHTHEDQP